MLNDDITSGYRRPVISNHEKPHPMIPEDLIFCLLKVCDKTNPKRWSDDKTCSVPCGFLTQATVDLSHGGWGALHGPACWRSPGGPAPRFTFAISCPSLLEPAEESFWALGIGHL